MNVLILTGRKMADCGGLSAINESGDDYNTSSHMHRAERKPIHNFTIQ